MSGVQYHYDIDRISDRFNVQTTLAQGSPLRIGIYSDQTLSSRLTHSDPDGRLREQIF